MTLPGSRSLAPATLVVIVLTALVASATSAVAATLITGAQIRDRSITAVDIARNTLTGNEINESRLARVPRAVTADRLAGRSASAFVGSDRVKTRGARTSNLAAGGTIVGTQILARDTVVGFTVSSSAQLVPTVTNTDGNRTLVVTWLSTRASSVESATDVLSPGQSREIRNSTINPSMVDMMVLRPAPGGVTVAARVTCASLDSNGTTRPQSMACVVTR